MKNLVNKLVEHALKGYRNHISPLKGYRSAHNVVYASGSCSDWALDTLRTDGAYALIIGIFSRLKACRNAYLSLSTENGGNGKSDAEENKCTGSDVASCCLNILPGK